MRPNTSLAALTLFATIFANSAAAVKVWRRRCVFTDRERE